MPKILLLEDNEVNRMLVLATLQGRYEILCAETVQQAEAMMGEHRFDLLLLDINVPGGGGLAVLEQAKAGASDAPAVAVTALAMKGDRERLLSAGFDMYVSKPFDTRALRNTVAQLLAADRSRAA